MSTLKALMIKKSDSEKKADGEMKRKKITQIRGCIKVKADDNLESITQDVRPDLSERGINVSFEMI